MIVGVFRKWLVALVACAAVVTIAAQPTQAHWLTKIFKEAGELGQDAAGTAARFGSGKLDDVASLAKVLPKPHVGKHAFAVHATPEGHWKFVSHDGQAFTAATPDEMARAVKVLAPEADSGATISLYLTEESVFSRAEHIGDLPKGAKLNMLAGRKSYPLEVRAGAGGSSQLFARVRSNVLLNVTNRADFAEAVWQLDRAMSKADVRVLSLKADGPVSLSSTPKRAKGSDVPLADVIDPAKLSEAMSSIRGQTALLTGRIEGDLVHVLPTNGPAQTLSLSDIRKAATAADVNLVVLHSAKPLQPGAQNWLWQTVKVGGLETALKKTTFGDFVDALAGSRGELVVRVQKGAQGGRVRLEALPDAKGFDVVDSVGNWVGDTVSEVAGHVVTEGVSAFANSKDRQKELDDRFVPGIPSDYQFYVIGAVVMGLIGFPVAMAWWRRIWPEEDRGEYRSTFGYVAARVVRWLVFLLLFLPIVGPFAMLGHFALKLWDIVLFPWRLMRQVFGPKSA